MTNDQLDSWNNRHALLMLVLSIIVLFSRRIELLGLGAIISFSSFIHRGSKMLVKIKPLGGYANWVTGFRLFLILMGCFLFVIVSKEILLALMFSAVLLDLVDGFLARRYKQTSIFGQFFDMEVDAFFVLIMCFYYYLFEGIGWWILIPGIMRYLFKIFTSIYPKEGFVETKKNYATIVAGTFFIILVACIVLDIPYALLIGSIAILLSFSISIIDYLRY